MDYNEVSQRLAFVQTEFLKYGLQYRKSGKNLFILCPFHAERTPSARVFLDDQRNPGSLNCLGCGANAKWDEWAPKVGLEPFKRSKPKDEYVLPNMERLVPEVDESNGEEFIQENLKFLPLPPDKKWRGIPTNFLISIGAKICKVRYEDGGLSESKLYLPVLVNGELRGYIKARFRKHPELPSYINAPGGWSRIQGLFPFDPAINLMRKLKCRTIVLVEGQRDALRLLMAGIPAMCIMGTQSWSANKATMLAAAGVKHLVLLFDGDCAGIEATQKIKPKLRDFDISVLKLWKMKGSPYLDFVDEEDPSKAAKTAGVSLWDPGNMPQSIIDKIKRKYFE